MSPEPENNAQHAGAEKRLRRGLTPQMWMVTLLTAGLSAMAGVCAHFLWSGPSPKVPPPQSVDRLLSASYPDDRNRLQALAQWKGKVLVLNFWATWCEPCREEMPDLMDVESKFGQRGLQIVGLAVDNPKAVSRYLQQTPVNYPILVSGADGMDVLEQAGSPGGLPFTVVIDRSGRWVASFLGRVDIGKLANTIGDLL